MDYYDYALPEDEDIDALIEQDQEEMEVLRLSRELEQKGIIEEPIPDLDDDLDMDAMQKILSDHEDEEDLPLFINSEKRLKVNSNNQHSVVEAHGLVTAKSHSNVQRTPSTQQGSVDYTKRPLTGQYLEARCPFTDKILYYPKVDQTKPEATSAVKPSMRHMNLLKKPIWKMLAEIKLEEQRNHEHGQKRLREEKEVQDGEGYVKKMSKRSKMDYQSAIPDRLWVDKYRPKGYMDLLGVERVHRDVLKWITQWDYCVFGKPPASENKWDKARKSYNNTFGGGKGGGSHMEKPKDRLLRPDRKIMLISGPPGLGKTTLAHVIAKHAGYNIIEINASDDRTGDVVSSKIKSSLEMQAIIKEPTTSKDGKTSMSLDQKPNCIIIDEIDGASSGGGGDSFIKQLVQLATAELKDKDAPAPTKKKGKKGPAPLLRPIICICNDLYAPVLRPLRAVAHSIQFRKIPMLTIAKRLQEICDQEGLRSDLRALSRLAEIADGDIRSCLNTLQFISGNSGRFTRDMLDGAGLGQKDMGKSLFLVWDELFSAPSGQRRALMHMHTPVDTNNRYLVRLTESVMTNGEFDKIMQGCFESYLKMSFHDVNCQKIVQMSDWLDFYDHLHHRTNNVHEYALYGYLPYPIINFHRYFAGASQQERVEYPRVEYENFAARKSFENLLTIFLGGIHPKRRRMLHKDMIATEIAPLLLRIISPELRPVNMQIIKPHEKAVLSKLVNIMIEFGLTFIQERNEDGQFVYKLDPPLEQIMNFVSAQESFKQVLPKQYAVRQLIAQEIDSEVIRRREQAAKDREKASPRKVAKRTIEEVMQDVTADKIPVKVARDFFGNPIEPSLKRGKSSSTSSEDVTKIPVAYHYHEGYSNAVKKPMNVHMFL